MSWYQDIYELVKLVPSGKVVTYGEVARTLGIKDARRVGWALHQNKSNEVPCHRVVDRVGRLAPNFAFNGAEEQRRRLEAEGVEFKDPMHVNLTKSGWRFE